MYDNILGGIHELGKWTFAISALFLLVGAWFAFRMKEPSSVKLNDTTLLKRFYRETMNHKLLLVFPIIAFILITMLSSISLTIDQQFTLTAAVLAKGVQSQYTVIIYGAAVVLFVMGLLDLYYELVMTDELKRPLSDKHEKSHFRELIDAFQDTELKKILPAWLFVMTIIGAIFTFLPIILSTGISEPAHGNTITADETFSSGLRASNVGLFFVVGIGILGSMQIVFGKLVDKYGRRPILLIGLFSILLLTIEIVIAVTFFPIWFTNPFHGKGLYFIIIAGITGLGVSAFGPAALTVLADNSNHHNRGTTAGIYSLLLGLGHILGDLIGGIAWDVGNHYGGRQGGAIAIFLFCFLMASLALLAVIGIHNPEVKNK